MATTNQIEETTLQLLHDRTRGDVLCPGDEGYEEARAVWNGRFDRRPAAIVQCTGAADVMAAVDFARENDLLLSVKGGGHDYAGNAVCEDGLMIDLSPMDAVRVDPEAKTARVQGGATWGAFDHEAQAFGLAVTGATVSTAGVAGVTLGGGTGYLARKCGLSLDSLLSADVVTAAGELVHASESENADLFWGLRGGSGNFGVVTSFEFQLHDVGPDVLAGQIVYPFAEAGEVLRFYRDFMAAAPDEIQCYAFIIHVPPLEVFPEEYHGKPALDLMVCHAGAPADGEAALQPLRDVGNPIFDGVRPQPYTALQQAFDPGTPKGYRWYSKAHYLDELSDDAIDTVLAYTASLPGPFTMAYFESEGGAIGRVDRTATAFPHRDAAFALHIFPGWTDAADDDACKAWAQEFHEAMAPYATGGVYVNLLGHDEEERVPNAYGDNYDRLVEVKNRWDPENLFRMNHNIDPAG